jgi:hypothetical protein
MQLQELEQQLKDSGALPYLLSGGAGALAGGALAAGTSRRGESRLGRIGRVLGTGLLSGAATAGAHKLFNTGMEHWSNALPVDDTSPEQEIMSGNGTRALAAGGVLAGATGARHMADKKIWSNLARQDADLWGPNAGAAPGMVSAHGAKDGADDTNNYKSFLDANSPKKSRPYIDAGLGELGIDSTSDRFKFLDSVRGRTQLDDVFNSQFAPNPDIDGTLQGLGIDPATGRQIHSADIGFKPSTNALERFLLKHEKTLMSARNKMVPLITKVTGRSIGGVAARAAGLGAAAYYPEILGTAKEQFTE